MAGGSITYTTEEQKKLFQDVLDGRVHLFALPTVLYRRIAEEMTTTVFKAFNLDFDTNLENPDFATPRALKRNLYDFSAAKTFQEIQDMQNFIFNEKGMRRSFSEFEAQAKTIFDTYNKNWLEAEFETATRLAESSNDWKQYTDEAEIFPLLKYNTLEDGSVREEHVALNGTVKPVNDVFWNTYNPPNGWRCRCFVEQLEAGEAPITEDPKEPELPKLFNFNAGKDDVVFHTSGAKMHPYFKVKSRFRRHKENNFGLPLPPDVANLKPKTLKKQKVEVKTDDLTIEQKIKKIKQEAKNLTAPTKEIEAITAEINEIGKPLNRINREVKIAIKNRKPLEEIKLVDEWNNIITAQQLKLNELNKIKSAYSENVLAILRQETSATFKTSATPTAKRTIKNLTFGERAFREIVGDRDFLKGKKVKFQKSKTGRAQHKAGVISLANNDTIGTVSHELAHWLELEDPDYFAKVLGFYKRRTLKDEIKKLRDIHPKRGYEHYEVTKEDKFIDAYTGKQYLHSSGRQRASEITPMWFTNVFKDLDGFIKKDPDHFESVYKFLNEGQKI